MQLVTGREASQTIRTFCGDWKRSSRHTMPLESTMFFSQAGDFWVYTEVYAQCMFYWFLRNRCHRAVKKVVPHDQGSHDQVSGRDYFSCKVLVLIWVHVDGNPTPFGRSDPQPLKHRLTPDAAREPGLPWREAEPCTQCGWQGYPYRPLKGLERGRPGATRSATKWWGLMIDG